MKKSWIFTLMTVLVLIPATLLFGARLRGKGYYLVSTLVILETMAIFFVSFESRRPQARELVILAVMAALAVASRVAVPIPHFKPIIAIIMLTGVAFGPQAGFMTGAIAAFASNFFYSQGPWTPWQMMSYGMGGFLAGLAFFGRGKGLRRSTPAFVAALTAFGFVTTVAVVGPLLDCSSLFLFAPKLTTEYVLSVFASGLAVNLTQALGCAVTMAVFGLSILGKLERLQTKYGMMNSHNVHK